MLLNPRSNVVQIRVQVLIFRLRLVLRVARRLDVGTADNGVRAMGRALLYDQRLHQLLQVFLVVGLAVSVAFFVQDELLAYDLVCCRACMLSDTCVCDRRRIRNECDIK